MTVAEECYQKALAGDPEFVIAYINLGYILERKGDYAQAHANYSKALAINPRNAHAHNSIGNLLKLQHLYDKAIGCYRKAITIDPRPCQKGILIWRSCCSIREIIPVLCHIWRKH